MERRMEQKSGGLCRNPSFRRCATCTARYVVRDVSACSPFVSLPSLTDPLSLFSDETTHSKLTHP